MQFKRLGMAVVVLTTIGILAGCGTVNGTTSATNGTNNTSNTTSKSNSTNNTTVPTSKLLTSNSTSGTSAPKTTVPDWFLHDIQLAEQANPSVGANYILNYGETNVYTAPQMNQVWYGALSGYSKNINFGYSWTAVYQQVKSDTPASLLSINVLEKTKQGGITVGLLVPAKCIALANGDYVAFTHGQAIIATNKSGEVEYSVYPVKGVTVSSPSN